MKSLQTIGREIYKGIPFNIYSTKDLFLLDGSDPEMYQLMYVDEGSVIIGAKGREESVFAPVMLCLNYSLPVSDLSLTGAKGFSIFFRPDVINHGLAGLTYGEESEKRFHTEQILINPFLKGGRGNPFHLPVNGAIRNRLLRMAENLELQLSGQPDGNWPCRGRSFFLEILMLLQSMFALESSSDSSLAKADPALYPVIREIHVHYPDSDLSPSTLARKAGVHPLILSWRFRKSVGVGVFAYMRHLRCAVAANLLKNTMLGQQEIARRCGYADERRFASDFRRSQGVAPLAWRDQFPNPYG